MLYCSTLSKLIFEADIAVFDKQNRCNLSDGDYEVTLKRVQNQTNHYPKINDDSPKKQSKWEELKPHDYYEAFSKLPILKFRLTWTKEKCDAYVDRPLPITIRNDPHHQFKTNKRNLALNGHDKTLMNGSNNNNNNKIPLVALYNIQSRIIYRFIYNNHSSQQTEACDNFNCPWCNLNCVALYSLLKHLKLCHPRFNFTYAQTEKSVRIDVTISDVFDFSYSGSPYDLIESSPSYFGQGVPTQRTPVTHILVCHPHRPQQTLSEFAEIDENEGNAHRPIIMGHNRTYYHIMTYTPIMPKELNDDSEDENDPAWLQNKTINMIDDFTDVNDGEKEMMKMWNLHIMRHNFVGDVQIVNACELFLEERGQELVQKRLYRNFLLHITNLSDYGLLAQSDFYAIVLRLRRLLITNTEGRDVYAKAIDDQLQNWQSQRNRDAKAKHAVHSAYVKKGGGMSNGRSRRIGKSSPVQRGRTRSSFSSPTQHSTIVISPNRKRPSTYRSLPTPTIKKYASENGREPTTSTPNATGPNSATINGIASGSRRRRAVQSLPDVDLRNSKVARFTRNRSHSQTRERRSLSATKTRRI